jgi:hypothetical protein
MMEYTLVLISKFGGKPGARRRLETRWWLTKPRSQGTRVDLRAMPARHIYEGVADENGNLVNEVGIMLPINHHLHEIRSGRIKRKSDYALDVAEALLKSHQSFVKHGKVPRRQVSAMVDAWNEEPEAKALTPKQQAMKAAFKEEKEMDEDYEDTAWQYFGDDNHDGRPRENIYLMRFHKRTLRQVFNLLRSKLVFEARLQKTEMGRLPVGILRPSLSLMGLSRLKHCWSSRATIPSSRWAMRGAFARTNTLMSCCQRTVV